ncbi:MAG: NfeD family protein [Puniceicoccaceae bacterium]
MTAVVALLVFALLFFFLEIFVPGGFLALIGLVCILGAAAAATSTYGWEMGLLVFAGGGLVVVIMFFIEVKWLLRSPLARRIQHQDAIRSASLKAVEVEAYVGQEAEAATPLTPSGRIRVDGKLLEAKSENGWVEAGEKVVILDSNVFHVRVHRKTPDI